MKMYIRIKKYKCNMKKISINLIINIDYNNKIIYKKIKKKIFIINKNYLG